MRRPLRLAAKGEAGPRRAKPRPAPESSRVVARPPTRAALAVRAERDPRSLTTDEVLQFQRAFGNRAVSRLFAGASRSQSSEEKGDQTGLPESLKAGVEALAGVSLDDVRVHYGSAEPAALRASACTRGTEIHLGPGQERHLPHEAWHVVQQKQGRVRPTTRAGGARANDDEGLEKDADVLGETAARAAASAQGARLHIARGRAGGATRPVAAATVQLVRPPKMEMKATGGTVDVAYDEIEELKTGATVVTYHKVRYKVAGSFRKEDYVGEKQLTFKLDKLRKEAKFLGEQKSHKDLKLDQKFEAKEQQKKETEDRVKAEIDKYKVRILNSAYRHCADGDGQSQHVGKLPRYDTQQFITDTLRDTADQLKYVGPGKNGGEECLINLGGKETVVFECLSGSQEVTVFHVGPGG
jgi:hypothetical protein